MFKVNINKYVAQGKNWIIWTSIRDCCLCRACPTAANRWVRDRCSVWKVVIAEGSTCCLSCSENSSSCCRTDSTDPSAAIRPWRNASFTKTNTNPCYKFFTTAHSCQNWQMRTHFLISNIIQAHKYFRDFQAHHAFINPHLDFLLCDVPVGGALEQMLHLFL